MPEPQLLSADPAAGKPLPLAGARAEPQLLSADPKAATVNATSPPPGPVGPSTAGDPFHDAHAAVRSGPYAKAAAATAPPPSGMATHAPTALQPKPPTLGGATTPSSLHAPTWRERLNDTISPETQRMIGGGAGALVAAGAAAFAPEIAVPAWIARTAAAAVPIAGAAVGGGATAAAQGGSVTEGATEQGLMEAGGQLVAWPIKAAGRRFLAHPVAKAAAKHLGEARTMVNQQLDTILAQAEGAVRGTRQGVADAVGRAREAVRGARAGVTTAEQAAASQTEHAAGKWPRAAGAPGPGGSTTATPSAGPAATPPSATAPPPAGRPAAAPFDNPDPADALRRQERAAAQPPAVQPPPAGSAREQVLADVRAGVKPTISHGPGPRPRSGQPGAAMPSHGPAPGTVPGPETYAQTGRDVAAVVKGPAKHSLDQLGEAVTEAAKGGPEVDMRPIKAKLEAMAGASRPSTQAGAATPGGEFLAAQAGKGEQGADRIAAALKAAGVSVEETHPLPGVLRQLQDAPDSLSFEDAHKIKRLLDEATNWNSPAKKQLQGITKGIRSELRTVMSSHEPYNTATEAYRSAVPLFTKGVAKQITRSVEEHPEGIVKLIRGDQPTKLQMLKDVLTHHATQGGGGEQGQAAWNGVRSSWTYEHLIKGGVEKFEGNLAKLHPDFLETMYGDADGKTVLGNLKDISQAFRQAQAQGEAGVGAAKAGVTAAQDTAARTAEKGRSAIAQKSTAAGATRAQVQAGKQPTAQELAFQQSSLAGAPPPSQVAGDVLHTVASHGGNVFRARSVGRLVLGGPKVNDLVQWAAYSSGRTQLLVKAVTSPAPGMAIADLMRSAGIAEAEGDRPRPMPSHASTAPPPK